MDQDSSRNPDAVSAVQSSEESETYSLSDAQSSKQVTTKPEIAESTVSPRPRRKIIRIRTSGEDDQSKKFRLENFAVFAYLASFVAHLGLVFGMAYWSLETKENAEALVLAGGKIVGLDSKLDEIQPVTIDLNTGDKSSSSAARKRVDLVNQEVFDGKIPTSIEDRIGESAISGDDVAGDLGFSNGTGGAVPSGAMKRGDNAVTKGSFTAWTIPENPKVSQSYLIVIQIKVPKKTKIYRASDLSGFIQGTDKYTQRLPFDPRIIYPHAYTPGEDADGNPVYHQVNRPPRDQIPIEDNVITFVVKVPGAKRAQVEDTIKIQSKLLKEKQTLKIVFGKQ